MAEMHEVQQQPVPERTNTLSRATNVLGATMSLALVVGISVWGYKVISRDVSGVPVVRAAEGPMRVQPVDPGGHQASHQGLSVNEVAADGSAARAADRLVLAPEPLELSLEDTLGNLAADTQPGEATVQLASVEALAAEIAAGVPPIEGLGTEAAQPQAQASAQSPKVKGGLGQSLRPKLRPVSLGTASPADTEDAPQQSVLDIDPDAIPVGTRLAQLGAFESAEIAHNEWDRLSEKFGEYLEGKSRVVQKATSGGRTFYRLRAMGFTDLSDARRFCSALVAENADCIPVVTR